MAKTRRPAAEAVRAKIEDLKLSQNALEKRLGLSRGALSHLLNERAPGLFGALLIAEALGVDPRLWLTDRQKKRIADVGRLIRAVA